jgi:hypothetical protein
MCVCMCVCIYIITTTTIMLICDEDGCNFRSVYIACVCVCMCVCMYVCVYLCVYNYDDDEVRGFMERMAATLEVWM